MASLGMSRGRRGISYRGRKIIIAPSPEKPKAESGVMYSLRLQQIPRIPQPALDVGLDPIWVAGEEPVGGFLGEF